MRETRTALISKPFYACRKVSVNVLEKIKIKLKCFIFYMVVQGLLWLHHLPPLCPVQAVTVPSRDSKTISHYLWGVECAWLDDAHQFATYLETDQITSQVMLCFPIQGSYHLHTESYPCHISASLALSS
jgi:hypothetical protein